MTPNRSLKLVKEQDNKFDKDAIAVYAQDKKIGYVANNDHTRCKLTLSASELQYKIQNTVQGRYQKKKKIESFRHSHKNKKLFFKWLRKFTNISTACNVFIY